jgi:PilZ domain
MNPISNASYTGVDQRQSPRTDVYARIPLVMEDGRTATVTVVNISADGLLMRHDAKLVEDSIVTVSLPVIGKVKGRAIWSLGGRSGINFMQSIELRDYQPLLRALGVAIAA